MNVIGERIKVLAASDPTLLGVSGLVVLETANTFMVQSQGRSLRIAKAGTAFQLLATGRVVSAADLAGRLQDRLGKRSP